MPVYTTPQARVNYKKKNDKEGYLLLKIQYQQSQINFNLSYYLTSNKLLATVERKYWDAKLGQTTHYKKFDDIFYIENGKRRKEKDLDRGRNNIEVNKYLDKIKTFIHTQFKNKADVSPEEIKLQLDYFTGKKDKPRGPKRRKTLKLFPFIKKFIEDEQKSGKRGTWKKFITVQNHLKEYEKEKEIQLTYKSIDWAFRNKFLLWLYEAPRNHSANNASKVFEVLKQFLQESYKYRYHKNNIYKERGFGVKRVKTKNKVRLNFEELKVLIDMDLSANIPFEKVRDLFIVGCYTGLRFSDWHKVGKENIIEEDGEELLEIFTLKTSKAVYIPLLPELKSVLEKYDYLIPKLTSQYFNRTIKEVCELANLDSMEMRVYSESGKTKEERLEKYKMVSSHCARRSFASNFYDMGIPAFIVMQITGHATEKQFFEYIDLSKKDLAKKFAQRVKIARKENYLKAAK